MTGLRSSEPAGLIGGTPSAQPELLLRVAECQTRDGWGSAGVCGNLGRCGEMVPPLSAAAEASVEVFEQLPELARELAAELGKVLSDQRQLGAQLTGVESEDSLKRAGREL